MVITKLLTYFLFLILGLNPLKFFQTLREKQFPPEARFESGMGFSKKVYPWLQSDYASPTGIQNQIKLLKKAGINSVQVYFNWPEMIEVNSREVTHFDNWRIPDMVVGILTEEGVEIHAEIFSHFPGIFESGAKNPDSYLPINVPANQVDPLNEIVRLGKTEQFRSWVSQLVGRYPQIKFWGFLNEIDNGGIYQKGDITTLQNIYYETIRLVGLSTMIGLPSHQPLVGMVSPTFPELIAPPEKLNPNIFEALGYYRNEGGQIQRKEGRLTQWLWDNYKISYPEYYDFWKEIYKYSKFDMVQVHQLGVRAWNSRGPWADDSFDENGNLALEKSSRWQILKAGIDNVRALVGNVPITSQVDIGTDLQADHSDYWRRIRSYFSEAVSGKYGYDFLDFYQLKNNFIELPGGKLWQVSGTFVFDDGEVPSPLYDMIQKAYLDYQDMLWKECVNFYFLNISASWPKH